MRGHLVGRNTQDIDLLVPADPLERIPEVRIVDRRGTFAQGEFDGLQVDFLLGSHALFDLVRQKHATRERFADRELVCATVPGLLLLKRFALPALYRQGRFSRVEDYEHDAAVLLCEHPTEMDPLFAELSRHLSGSDLAEVRDIVAGIERRIAASRSRFGGTPKAE